MAIENHTIHQKQCTLCKAAFPRTSEYFNKDKHSKDGLHCRCRKCHNKRQQRQLLLPGFKRCSSCEVIFVATEANFYFDKRASDGFYSCCKSCFLERSHKWYNSDLEKSRSISLSTYYRYHDERLAYGRQYRENNSEKVSRKNQRWAQNNREKVRATTLRRVARKAGAEGTHTAADVLALYDEQCGLCAYCGIRLYDDYHVDHLVPLIRGGSDYPDNLLITCPFCNTSKATKLLSEWVKVRGW